MEVSSVEYGRTTNRHCRGFARPIGLIRQSGGCMAVAADYRPELDGLRAVAVGLVLAFHFFPEWLPGGFVGVDVFFVISGYLITRRILAEVDAGRFSLTHFYARRARRILPALTVVLLATLLAGWLLLFPDDFKRLAVQTLAAAFLSPTCCHGGRSATLIPLQSTSRCCTYGPSASRNSSTWYGR